MSRDILRENVGHTFWQALLIQVLDSHYFNSLAQSLYKKTGKGGIEMAGDFSVIVSSYYWKWSKKEKSAYKFMKTCKNHLSYLLVTNNKMCFLNKLCVIFRWSGVFLVICIQYRLLQPVFSSGLKLVI